MHINLLRIPSAQLTAKQDFSRNSQVTSGHLPHEAWKHLCERDENWLSLSFTMPGYCSLQIDLYMINQALTQLLTKFLKVPTHSQLSSELSYCYYSFFSIPLYRGSWDSMPSCFFPQEINLLIFLTQQGNNIKLCLSGVFIMDSCEALICDYLKVLHNFSTLFFSLTASL